MATAALRSSRSLSYPVLYFRRAWIYLDMGRSAQAMADFSKFELERTRQGLAADVFWPDERGAIARLRELHRASTSRPL